MELKTTTDCVNKANKLLEEAKSINNRDMHAKWWDKKVELFKTIQNALESGAFNLDARYELHGAKYILKEGERIAGQYLNK
ncbi:hypothetical protein DA469_21315 [Bacillus subtilis]|nr:hypothetical protein DA469_21315 [Bacillus subtilis]